MSSDTTLFQTVRRYAFYVAVVIAIGLPVFMIREALLFVATGWTGFLGTHSVHDLVLFAVMWMALLGLAVQLYKPLARVNAILAMPLIMIPAAVIGFIAGTEIAMMGVIFGALGLLALALHPAGRSLLRFDRVASPNRLLVGLFAIGAVAMLAYGGLELGKQFTVADDHSVMQHYGDVSIAALYVAVMAGLATLRERDWRFAAWSAGFVALYIGASSAVFPSGRVEPRRHRRRSRCPLGAGLRWDRQARPGWALSCQAPGCRGIGRPPELTASLVADFPS